MKTHKFCPILHGYYQRVYKRSFPDIIKKCRRSFSGIHHPALYSIARNQCPVVSSSVQSCSEFLWLRMPVSFSMIHYTTLKWFGWVRLSSVWFGWVRTFTSAFFDMIHYTTLNLFGWVRSCSVVFGCVRIFMSDSSLYTWYSIAPFYWPAVTGVDRQRPVSTGTDRIFTINIWE